MCHADSPYYEFEHFEDIEPCLCCHNQEAPSEAQYYDQKARTRVHYGHLPHWQQHESTYFVTFRLNDSLPKKAINKLLRMRQEWIDRSINLAVMERPSVFYLRLFEQLDTYLESGHGRCFLKAPNIRGIFRSTLIYANRDYWDLHSWVIMPNHTHLLLTMKPDRDLPKALQLVKSYSARHINKELERKGRLWKKESFDHLVRTPSDFLKFQSYILNNPRHLQPGTFCVGLRK